LNISDIFSVYNKLPQLNEAVNLLGKYHNLKLHIPGLKGSSKALITSLLHQNIKKDQLHILPDVEDAVYFMNDLQSFADEKKIIYFPSPFKKENPSERSNPSNLQRIEALNIIKKPTQTGRIIITYPQALVSHIITKEELQQNTSVLQVNTRLDIDFLMHFLFEYEFERTDFVSEAGNFSVRGGIIDIFSYANSLPYRIELIDDKIESIREFDPETQLSLRKMDSVTIIPNFEATKESEKHISFFEYISSETLVFVESPALLKTIIEKTLIQIRQYMPHHPHLAEHHYMSPDDFINHLGNLTTIDLSNEPYYKPDETIRFSQVPQPNFNKNFNLLAESLIENTSKGIDNYIFSESAKQIERLYAIFEDQGIEVHFYPIYKNLHNGFFDFSTKIACYTEHEIFNRYHASRIPKTYSKDVSMSLKELYQLKPGDYVTHINHGIGKFSGLQKIDVGGKKQEAIRLEYKDGDLLYVSIHSLHKIARYAGKEGIEPKLHRLGSSAWDTLKQRTKNRVKDIARDLIKLYAQRKAQKGFEFSPDTYLQTELEASFIYEDTPDQTKSTEEIKLDMERSWPMDRLVCGDVGYGKTEVAIRAAFKAVADSKQVAVMVPTTILAFQHNKTFTERLKDFPCNIDYLSRFKSAIKQKDIMKRLENGKIDIIIGTHKLLSEKIKFKDLGLLIIDEEQKFGVAAKERLRKMKVNVDTLSLTATPIPRTLQFSLMGVRDLTIINTPPPNRQAIETKVGVFDDQLIKEAIEKEIERNGQVFLVHNRIKDLQQTADLVKKLIPYAKVALAHGQMENQDLEEIMLNFIDGYYDVLVSTNIIESGLDIPNANTIIINEAQNFGLSDLYQMRGRVGRSNAKAYCYMLIPSYTVLTSDARKRLAAIEEFTELGSGFHIAMRDLDIRGAGNLLGAEQSGFISEIGLDMYRKILDEAIQELKYDEFGDLFVDESPASFFKETVIDTDFEVLIPDSYIENIEERLILYNKLNRISSEKELKKFETELIDRFGKMPSHTSDLLDLIRIKWKATRFGIEKLNLKKNKVKAFFPYIHAQNSQFQNHIFEKLLRYVKNNLHNCKFQEEAKGLYVYINDVGSIEKALDIFSEIDRS
jgi:transcription-repair coupling factor (superfamily II helicase)